MTASWLPAPEALRRLGVRPKTLYAYVSRGLVEARPDPDDPRRSLYRATDVDGLSQRKARGRRATDVASHAIAYGEPVLATEISTVARGRLFYRGQDAARLAETFTLEQVAGLLWGQAQAPEPADAQPQPLDELKARAFAALGALAASGPPTAGRTEAHLAKDGAEVMGVLAAAVSGRAGHEPAHLRLASAWRADADLVRRALVLMADHELNASTFAARVAVSTGASLAAAVLAGLAALSGPRHGAHFMRVRAFLDETRAKGAAVAVQARLAQGVQLPGFGHPLYAEGDPRAAALLRILDLAPEEEEAAAAVLEGAGALPNIDFALCVLARAERLPPDAPFALFAAGRCVGWIAHALEQNRTGTLIRPRARYVGPEPG